jgi:hypothetical protein
LLHQSGVEKKNQKKVAHFEKIVAAGRVSAPLFLTLQKGLKVAAQASNTKKSGGRPKFGKNICAGINVHFDPHTA